MYSNWTFLSKHGADPYINMLAESVSQPVVEDLDFNAKAGPIVLRGIMKHKLMKQCWQQQRRFYYVDTGYFGNEPTARNPQAAKLWHRIVPDDLQHSDIRARPADRWQGFGRKLPQRQRTGTKIIVAAPDDKPCRFYGIDRDTWMHDTVDTLRRHTDRDIVVRERTANRAQRMLQQPLTAVLPDAHVLVTFNSLAAVEAIMSGVPAIVTAPTHAAAPVASHDLATAEDPVWPDPDLLYQWLCHLAYGQFHVSEMRSGKALEMLESMPCP
jgi:hypothetical protein